MKDAIRFFSGLLSALCVIASVGFHGEAAEWRICVGETSDALTRSDESLSTFAPDALPAYAGEPYAVVNGNIPDFADEDLTAGTFERYSELDRLGRCGTAYANISRETMPSERRGAIGMTRPSGWHTVRYDDLIEGKYLYNRCHLIAYRLAGENANARNLITGTRYLNVAGMAPFEKMVGDYAEATGNHVLYRVTPIFEGENLVASGVRMEAYSVEDNGGGVCFHVYVYNVQPGVAIDYATGESHRSVGAAESVTRARTETAPAVEAAYILNRNTKKFHYSDCGSVSAMSERNKEASNESREAILARGYSPCGKCRP